MALASYVYHDRCCCWMKNYLIYGCTLVVLCLVGFLIMFHDYSTPPHPSPGGGPHQWEVLWFCWMLGLFFGSMVGVADVMQAHPRTRGSSSQPPRCVVVTGSSRGLGKALAREFLLSGDDVVVTSRR